MNISSTIQPISQSQGNELAAINSVRFLAIDAVENANSGHPGMPMGMASAAVTLWTRHLRFVPSDPHWLNRDRFVLSAGHGSMLLYSLLHLSGYDLSITDLAQFRQWGSRTPGHPETHVTPGVELTTGPLGQGISSAVGLAIEESYLRSLGEQDGLEIDYRTYVIAGDGCLQEGVSSEAASLAGHLKLGRLIVLYDDNGITIDGPTHLSFTEDVSKRFEAYGWQVINDVDGNSVEAVDQALVEAKADTERPTLIRVKTTIGYGSPNKAGSHSVHGSPLGAAEIKLTRAALNWSEVEAFSVPKEAYAAFDDIRGSNLAAYSYWMNDFKSWQQNDKTSSPLRAILNPSRINEIASMFPDFEPGTSMATRSAQGEILNLVMPSLPFILGGSADLTPSNNTQFKGVEDFNETNRSGRYIRFGVREHAMGSIINGLSAGGALRAYGATFLVFSDYMRAAVRVAALSGYPSIFIFTHDSIGLGEDGPTHQPVESLAALRAIPGLTTYRPADANETSQCWRLILERKNEPAAIMLSRQKLPVMNKKPPVERGAYLVESAIGAQTTELADAILYATGSEVEIALQAQQKLHDQGIAACVVSMPSWELFAQQDQAYQDSILPNTNALRVAIEAGIEQGWHKFIGIDGIFIGMVGFGASAPAPVLYEKFGITADNVVQKIKERLS